MFQSKIRILVIERVNNEYSASHGSESAQSYLRVRISQRLSVGITGYSYRRCSIFGSPDDDRLIRSVRLVAYLSTRQILVGLIDLQRWERCIDVQRLDSPSALLSTISTRRSEVSYIKPSVKFTESKNSPCKKEQP
jgi:hypothetical protein